MILDIVKRYTEFHSRFIKQFSWTQNVSTCLKGRFGVVYVFHMQNNYLPDEEHYFATGRQKAFR